ncbi:MAG: hypothetical protein OXH04_12520 [Acidobacteria bacterium]|nr:hypothetical protein [Acidobacteriota bacterium]
MSGTSRRRCSPIAAFPFTPEEIRAEPGRVGLDRLDRHDLLPRQTFLVYGTHRRDGLGGAR